MFEEKRHNPDTRVMGSGRHGHDMWRVLRNGLTLAAIERAGFVSEVD